MSSHLVLALVLGTIGVLGLGIGIGLWLRERRPQAHNPIEHFAPEDDDHPADIERAWSRPPVPGRGRRFEHRYDGVTDADEALYDRQLMT